MNIFEVIIKVFYYLIVIPVSIGFCMIVSRFHGFYLFLILFLFTYIFYVAKYNRQTMESIESNRANAKEIERKQEGKSVSKGKMLEHRLKAHELLWFSLSPLPASKGDNKSFFVEWDKFLLFCFFSMGISIIFTIIIDKTDILNFLYKALLINN